MKILQVNCVYRFGSTGKITYDIHSQLQSEGIESIVCYGRRDRYKERGIYKITGEGYAKVNNLLSRFTGLMYGGCILSTNKLIHIIKKEKPDIVHLQCINGYFVNIYRLVDWLKIKKIPTVLTLHAEFMYTANCGHSYECNQWVDGCRKCKKYKDVTHSFFFDNTSKSYDKMKKAFEGFNRLTVVSVSPWLMSRAKQSLILRDKHHEVIFNGLDTDIFHHYADNSLLNELGMQKKKMILHVTADFSDPMKGGQYIVELARRMPETVFVIIGSYRKDLDLPKNIINVGRISNQNLLAQYYSTADLTVVTSKRETFSMICAESLSCGTPVVGFNAGAPEQISIKEYSEFCDYGDIAALYNLVNSWINRNISHLLIEDAAKRIYSKKEMYFSYLRIYKELLERIE